jgi:hydroxyacylglutathione hydrolase
MVRRLCGKLPSNDKPLTTMLELRAIPALLDNYIWVVSDTSGRAVIVDPGEAAPVVALAAQGLTPVAVLLTHHHPDHVAGAAEIIERWNIPCHAPDDDRIVAPVEIVEEGAQLNLLEVPFRVIEVPGHTRSHIAFIGAGHLFCGDTLFSLGCGRMFEGTPAQMLASLDRLAALPEATRVCCGHEYTLTNGQFARAVDPDNLALQQQIVKASAARARQQPSVPSRICDENACNPFLRTSEQSIRNAVCAHSGTMPADRVETFAALRRWKDEFKAR